MNIDIIFPRPHNAQQEVLDDNSPRKVICAGRRFGKTTLAAMEGVKKALNGKRVLFASPTQEQVDTFWEMAKVWLNDGIQQGVIYKNETKRKIILPNNGQIRAKTAYNADTLRGDYADFLVLDEYAMMNPDTWDAVGAPMLLDNGGDAWFISTPRRKNHFFRRYVQALGDGKRWKAWKFPTMSNPHLDKDAVDDITRDMLATTYKQEILAEFLESEGEVFRNIDNCLNTKSFTPDDFDDDDTIVAGVDWAKQNDYTCVSIFNTTTCQEVAIDRFNKIDYKVQRQRIAKLCNEWNVNTIVAETNAMGEPNIEELERDGFEMVRFNTTAKSKPALIESLALAFDKAEAFWIDDPAWTGELEAYEIKTTNSGRVTYSAPAGVHDDTVIARALAWYGKTNQRSIMIFGV